MIDPKNIAKILINPVFKTTMMISSVTKSPFIIGKDLDNAVETRNLASI